MANLTYQIKKLLPSSILTILSVAKRKLWQVTYARKKIEFKDDYPYSSPNIWQRVEKFYLNLPNPVVFEFGTGVSSLRHICNLIKHGSGVYIGVEHKRVWYTDVINAVISHCIESGLTISASITCSSSKVKDGIQLYDSEFLISRPSSAINCKVILKLRPPLGKYTGDGSIEEFQEYVAALNQECDVVIVDGRARKACVARALDTNYLRAGGLLALFEAGRGQEGWLGYLTQTGTLDYRPAVQRMLDLGGELVDGCGIDHWPGQKRRRFWHSVSFYYPAEACFVIKP